MKIHRLTLVDFSGMKGVSLCMGIIIQIPYNKNTCYFYMKN